MDNDEILDYHLTLPVDTLQDTSSHSEIPLLITPAPQANPTAPFPAGTPPVPPTTAPTTLATNSPTPTSTVTTTATPIRHRKLPKKNRRVTVSDVQKVQIDVLELEKEKLKVEIENVRLIQQKLKMEIQEKLFLKNYLWMMWLFIIG